MWIYTENHEKKTERPGVEQDCTYTMSNVKIPLFYLEFVITTMGNFA